jgi:N-alpha-acetyltransferase 38, NatC auxiliary subunit
MIQTPYIKEDERSRKAVKTIKDTFLGKNIKITINDGRTFEGRFVCIDSEVNVILQGTYEYRIGNQSNNTEIQALNVSQIVQKRWAGMVMIPGQHITNVEVVQVSNAATTAGEAMYG